MQVRTWMCFGLLVLALCPACSAETQPKPKRVRPPALAGTWYPGRKDALRQGVRQFVSSAEKASMAGRVIALVAPHAGYRWSGPVAGWAYRQLADEKFARVIVLAPSHRGRFRGFSIMDVDAYATPLGEVPLDREVCEKLRKHDLHVEAEHLHAAEHAIEIHLPFLQVLLGEFKLVPVLVSGLKAGDGEKIAVALNAHVSERTLIVVSSDFTHYGWNHGYVPFTEDVEENLRKLDMAAVELILMKDFDGFNTFVSRTGATICGRHSIAILLKMLPSDAVGRLLRYDTSGRMTNDFSNSVSYVSIAFVKPSQVLLGEDEQKTLLRLARETIEGVVRTGKMPELDESKYQIMPHLKARGAAFVTLKKQGELRGCVGRTGYPQTAHRLPPLYETVRLMAVESALHDTRFPPVRPDELEEIQIEISVLSIAEEVSGPEKFEVGKHGIIIWKGSRSAVFLPHVALEQKWSREETLRHLCIKAGLPEDEWEKPGMKFFIFAAQVFGESSSEAVGR